VCSLAALLGGDLHVLDRDGACTQLRASWCLFERPVCVWHPITHMAPADGMRGVRFGLRLPLNVGPPPSPVSPIPDPAPAAVLGATHTSGQEERAAQEDGRGRILLRRTVLVVDDSEGNRRLARRMLLQMGCRVLEAADGDEVLGVLKGATAVGRHAVDVVLMDIEMVRVDGVTAVREMRQAGWSIPVIAVTGNADGETITDCASKQQELWQWHICALQFAFLCVRLYGGCSSIHRRHDARVQSRPTEAVFAEAAA
jgi:CheY-like chemotaxis protein